MAFVALKKMVQVIPVRSILKSQIVNPTGFSFGLFLLYINDLHYCIKTGILQTILICSILSKSVWSLCGRVNANIRILVSWLNAKKISLNASTWNFNSK